jgi:hypothetical protein
LGHRHREVGDGGNDWRRYIDEDGNTYDVISQSSEKWFDAQPSDVKSRGVKPKTVSTSRALKTSSGKSFPRPLFSTVMDNAATCEVIEGGDLYSSCDASNYSMHSSDDWKVDVHLSSSIESDGVSAEKGRRGLHFGRSYCDNSNSDLEDALEGISSANDSFDIDIEASQSSVASSYSSSHSDPKRFVSKNRSVGSSSYSLGECDNWSCSVGSSDIITSESKRNSQLRPRADRSSEALSETLSHSQDSTVSKDVKSNGDNSTASSYSDDSATPFSVPVDFDRSKLRLWRPNNQTMLRSK